MFKKKFFDACNEILANSSLTAMNQRESFFFNMNSAKIAFFNEKPIKINSNLQKNIFTYSGSFFKNIFRQK